MDDFPDDSLFRNSNVAYLEEALIGKENCESSAHLVLKTEQSFTKDSVVSKNELVLGTSRSASKYASPSKAEDTMEEDDFGLPLPHKEELKFISLDMNDLSNVLKESETSQLDSAKEPHAENVATSSARPLSEQNPATSSEKSISDKGDSSFPDKSEYSTTKNATKKPSRRKESQSSVDHSSNLSNQSKNSNNKSTRCTRSRKEKSISPDEKPSKLEKNVKRKGYQPLQLNITKSSRHEEGDAKKKLSPENLSATTNKSTTLSELSETFPEDTIESSRPDTTNSINDDTLLSTQQRLQLKSWGFPETILTQYANRGVTQMFPWQVECLCQPNVLNGGNLIYSAPTSAGKTLVAEILCIKTVLERKKKAIFILPFVSVVREKMFYFQDLLGSTGIRVEGFMGGHSPPGGFRSLDIAVCTIEKANGIVNRLLEDEGLSSLGAVVVDELHLLGDPFRGYLLELLLTKLKYMGQRNENIQVQIIGMSATLPNLSLLATWLDAALYSTSYRPVPLSEYVKIGPHVYNNQLKPVRMINPEIKIKGDTDHIVYLCLETVVAGHSVLIFCPTKNWCESLATTIAEEFRNIGLNRDPNAPESLGYKLREELNAEAIMQTLEQLKRCPAGLDGILARTVSFGVSFHHAGMTLDERDIIEGSFRQGTLRVIVATSTLSSGVNLPARRVIIRSPTFHGRLIDVLTYKQMIGRAGRMGKDTAGESFLICTKTDQRLAEQLVKSSLRPVSSSLGQKGISGSLKRAILEVIASGVAQTPDEVNMYIQCTLLAACSQDASKPLTSSAQSSSSLLEPILACVDHLRENEFVRLQQCEDGVTKYVATPLGHACLAASISPDEGLTLFRELQRARQCFVLETELHVIYQVTPLSVAEQWGDLDWLHVLTLWEKLPPEMKRVGELVGFEDRFIIRAMKGTVNLKTEKQHQRLLVHRRFYTALALHDLVNEVPISQVAAKFGCNRGMLQSLQQTASTFAGMVTAFSRRLGWSSVEILVEQFQDRLHFGTHRELLDLLRLSLLNGPRARAIFKAGITSVTELTTADTTVIEDALLEAMPFQSEKGRDGESEHELERRRRLKSVWIAGRAGLTARQAAELLIAESRELVQKELGVKKVNWEEAEDSITYDESRLSQSRSNVSILPPDCSVNPNSSIVINTSKKEESNDDSVFKVPKAGPVKKGARKQAKTSPSKIERILKSMDIEPVNDQGPEKIIGQKFAENPSSKWNFEESVITSVETDRTESSARDADISSGSTDVSSRTTPSLAGAVSSGRITDVSSGSTANSSGTTANSMETSSSSSETTANSSSASANSSRTTANSSGTTFTSSRNTANSSSASAHSSRTTANSSRTTANSSESTVNSSGTTVSSSRTTANSSSASANLSKTTANAFGTVNSSGTTADTSGTSANWSETTAHSSETTANSNGTSDGTSSSAIESDVSKRASEISLTIEAESSTRMITRETDVSTRCSAREDVSTTEITSENLSTRRSFSVCETSTNSDLFEQNICEIDAALHSSMNSPSDVKVTSQKKIEKSISINLADNGTCSAGDVFFESLSLSESAFKDMSAMRQPDDTKSESNNGAVKTGEVPGANSAISGDSGMGDVCFSMSSMNESAFTRNSIPENKITALDDKTTSQDISNPFSVVHVTKKSKRRSLNRSLHTPSPPWNLRSRKNGSSSGSSRQNRRKSLDDMFASPLLRDSPKRSPSLFGDSFEIDSQLRNALDCNLQTTDSKKEEISVTYTVSARKRKIVDSPVTVFIDSFGSNLSSDLNSSDVTDRRTRSAKRKFFGSAKIMTPTDLSSTATLNRKKSISQSTPLRPQPSGKSEKDDVDSILTDSFLEAAFQSAFECDTATTAKKVSPKETLSIARHLQYSPGDELERSIDEDIPATPHKRRKISDKSSRTAQAEKRTKIRDAQIINDQESPTETAKVLRSSKIEKCEETHTGRPVGLSVPRSKISEKKQCKEKAAVKMNEDKSKTEERKFIDTPKDTKKKSCSDWSKMNIIDVCENREVFNDFKKSIFQRGTLSIALGCEKIPGSPKNATMAIGTRVVGMPKTRRKTSLKLTEPVLQYDKIRLVSLAVCAGNTDVYHVALHSDPSKATLPVSFEDRMDFMRKLFVSESPRTIACYDLKEQFKMLFRCAHIVMTNIEGRDLKIADWLVEPEEKEKNLHAMALNYYPPATKIAEMSGCRNARRAVSAALNAHLDISARKRACAEAIVCWHVSRAQIAKLKELHLLKSFTDFEMPVVLGFARLELNGIGFDRDFALALRERLKNEMSVLQERAYELAGRTFSMSSTTETARVIYQELGLGNVQKTQGARSFASTSCSGPLKQSTNKQALSRLRHEHPLPEVILMWRKLNSLMTKTFYPLLKTQATNRLFGCCILHSATGRISMHEPNLQNMPRDFEIPSISANFSVRSSFVPKAGNILVAADYSQLELRLLAHLSGDITLRDILNSGRDVFKSIAKSWNKIPEDQVTDDLRQRAKQVCYGMIYGIGKHALAEQLGVEDEDAEMFMLSFKSAYPGVNNFLQDTVEECRTKGYIETITGRRRYLPAITSNNSAEKAHAERQAVNTTVQGSAADLTKAAMIAVDREISKKFSSDLILYSDSSKGAYLVLQLHDELLYEVAEDYVDDFIKIVRHSMESAMTLSVKLPVKVRAGLSWGTLEEVS